jgi:glycosyltransferase involved in cell wall biosynthesis
LCSVSSTESFGLSILEAQSFGLPVISTRSGGPEDLINKHNGTIIEVGNIEQIKNAMMSIIDNKENYDSTKIRHACLNKYHPEVITEELISIYRKTISSRNLKNKLS